jgi:ParB family chromosome partitioning protein
MNLNTKKIYLKTIDHKDKTFLLSYGYDLNPLKQSIKQVGVLNPPLLRKKSNATYQIICGYKRIHALRELGFSSSTCTIVPSKTSDKKSLLLSLYDNTYHREFNPIEKSMIINKLLNYYSEEKIVHDFLPVLKLQPHISQLKAFKPLCRLEKEIKDAILEGKISEHTAIQLSQMDRASRRVLAKLLIVLKLSVSKQAEILEYVSEIAIRESLTMEKVINASEMRSILSSEELNQPQKGEAIRNYLRERRYPQLAEKEREFTYNLKQLKLHPHIYLKPPPFFEGNHYHLSLHFKDLEELKKRLQELESLLNNHSLLKITEG